MSKDNGAKAPTLKNLIKTMVNIMKTLNVNESLAAFAETCAKCEATSRTRGVMSDADTAHVERKLVGILRTLSGSRYQDVRDELKGLADVIDMSGRNQ